MPRSDEVVRQWRVLRSVAAARLGLTIDRIAAEHGVTARTIRRDLAALERAGFPLYQDKNDSGVHWKVGARSLGGLDAGFTLVELCALYFGRATLECLTGAPFQEELTRAFGRFEQALTPGMRQFLDRLPSVVGVKETSGRKRPFRGYRERVRQLLEASVHGRKVRMRYNSLASRRVKDYDVDPHRVVYAEGGLYLIAHVPEYGETRTFAVERIERLTVRDERITRPANTAAVFPHSLGVHSGPPERVELELSSDLAEQASEREWHPSQKVQRLADGRARLEMHVSIDWALKRWVLGFGSRVRVLSPSSLADEILDELDAARSQYVPRLDLDLPRHPWDLTAQASLPFANLQRLT